MNSNKIKKQKIRKSLIFSLYLVLFLIAVLISVTYYQKMITSSKIDTNNQFIDNNPPTPEQKAAGELQKETVNTPENNNLGISITSINTSSDPIRIKSVIGGAISNSGTCTLLLIKGETNISKTAETYAMPNSSTCKGFDINKSELIDGEWLVKLTVSIDGKESSINDKFDLEL